VIEPSVPATGHPIRGIIFDLNSTLIHGGDPAIWVAAALELAAGPASAPREVVLATKASMRATASPGSLDTEMHHSAMRIELGPQAISIRSPQFQSRLAAAQKS